MLNAGCVEGAPCKVWLHGSGWMFHMSWTLDMVNDSRRCPKELRLWLCVTFGSVAILSQIVLMHGVGGQLCIAGEALVTLATISFFCK